MPTSNEMIEYYNQKRFEPEYYGYFLDTAIPFDIFLTELKSNIPARTVLNVSSYEFGSSGVRKRILLSDVDFLAFSKALKDNNTLAKLYLRFGKITPQQIKILIKALRENTSIVEFDYDYGIFPDNSNVEINEIIHRNRDIALNRTLTPVNCDFSNLLKSFRLGENESELIVMKRLAFRVVEEGNINLLYSLVIEKKELLQETNFLYESLLNHAVKHAQIDCVKLLISLGADVNFNPVDNMGTQKGAPINIAVKGNFVAIAKLLIKSGADVSSKWNGFPALHDVRSLEMAKLLVDSGADVFALCGEESRASICRGNNILHSISHARSPSPELLQFFVDFTKKYQKTHVQKGQDTLSHENDAEKAVSSHGFSMAAQSSMSSSSRVGSSSSTSAAHAEAAIGAPLLGIFFRSKERPENERLNSEDKQKERPENERLNPEDEQEDNQYNGQFMVSK